MSYPDFKMVVRKIVGQDSRYNADAYEFISEAVNFTAAKLKKDNSRKNRHVSCVELLHGVGEYARLSFGPMAGDIFEQWGLKSSKAIGDVVFNMIHEKLLSASENDSVEQFAKGPDFYELFRKPYQPKGLVRAQQIDY